MTLTRTLQQLSPAAISTAPRNVIRELWDRTASWPGAKQLFSVAIGLAAPYSHTIRARVEELTPGHSQLVFRDRHTVRNHLSCVHAIALANLAELAGNIALAYSLPDDARFIVTGLSMEYLKKARGTIRATGRCPVPPTAERQEYVVNVELKDASHVVVATCTLRSLVGPKPGVKS